MFLLEQSHLSPCTLLRWLIKWLVHSHTTLLIHRAVGYSLSALFRTHFLSSHSTDRIFQIFVLVSFRLTILEPSFSLLALYCKWSGRTRQTFVKKSPQLNIQFHCNFIAPKSYTLENTRTQIQFSQVLCHFITRMAFSPLSHNMSLLPI